MDRRTLAYWITTALFCLAMSGGGVADLLLIDQVKEGFTHLGYPHYFARILGSWKIIGGLTLLLPGLARFKEWAYAGFLINLSSALFSHLTLGDSLDKLAPPVVLMALGTASYLLRPASRCIVEPTASAEA